jgi:hypothetical protein
MGAVSTSENGIPTSSTAEYTGIATTGFCGLGSIPPSPISNENGTRNFTEAATQTPYRTRAWFLRSSSVTIQATAANAVDCQR